MTYLVDRNWCELKDACAFCGEPPELYHPFAVHLKKDCMPRALLCRGCREVDLESLMGASTACLVVPCAFCGKPVEGNYAIHRDGGIGLGPEVPLCDECGGSPDLECDEIWARTSRRISVSSRVLSSVLLRLQQLVDAIDEECNFVHEVAGEPGVRTYPWTAVIAQVVSAGVMPPGLAARVVRVVWGCPEAQDVVGVQVSLGVHGVPALDCMMQAVRQLEPAGYARLLPELQKICC